MENQKTEHHPSGIVILPVHAFYELRHALKLAFALSFGQGIQGQHLRTAITQFLHHLGQSGSSDGDHFQIQVREMSIAHARTVMSEALDQSLAGKPLSTKQSPENQPKQSKQTNVEGWL